MCPPTQRAPAGRGPWSCDGCERRRLAGAGAGLGLRRGAVGLRGLLAHLGDRFVQAPHRLVELLAALLVLLVLLLAVLEAVRHRVTEVTLDVARAVGEVVHEVLRVVDDVLEQPAQRVPTLLALCHVWSPPVPLDGVARSYHLS